MILRLRVADSEVHVYEPDHDDEVELELLSDDELSHVYLSREKAIQLGVALIKAGATNDD